MKYGSQFYFFIIKQYICLFQTFFRVYILIVFFELEIILYQPLD